MNKSQAFLFSFLLIFTSIPQVFAAQVVTYDQLLHAIRETRAASQARITAAVDQEKVREAWETGKLIDQHILLHKERAEYGGQVIERLSVDLGTDRSELNRMVEFARAYPIRVPGRNLTWSHYKALLAVNDAEKRAAFEKEAEEKNWSRDVLRDEIKKSPVPLSDKALSSELPPITPGPLNTHPIIRLKDRLKIDLGFGLYLDLPEKDSRKFKEGDRITLEKGKLKKAEPSPLFTYSATVTSVVDGDTFHALIDLGFGLTLAQRVRLRRIDAPEILTADGKEAKAHLEKILSRDQGRILMRSVDIDQHGRPIADVWVKGKPIDQEMFDQGLAITVNE